jgi:hypothetical protein
MTTNKTTTATLWVAATALTLFLAACTSSSGRTQKSGSQAAIGQSSSQGTGPSPSTALSEPAGWSFVDVTSRYGHQPSGYDDSQFYALSCPQSTFCMLSSGTEYLVYRDGRFEGPTPLEDQESAGAGYSVRSLSCSSPRFCMALDDGRYLTFDGTKWSAPTTFSTVLPSSSDTPTGPIACPADNLCVGVGGTGSNSTASLLTFSSGQWTDEAVRSIGVLYDVQCASSSFCLAQDNGGGVFVWNGTAWNGPDSATGGVSLDGLTCVPGPFCLGATHESSEFFADTGAGFRPMPGAPALGAVTGACAPSRFCVYVGVHYQSLYDVYSGTSWSEHPAVGEVGSVFRLACPATGFCIGTVGQRLIVATYRNGS